MHEMTAGNLRSAFGGESMAHMRYRIWAGKAEAEGFANVARLFRAIAEAEQTHAKGHFKAMGDLPGAFLCAAGGGFGLGTTAENLDGAIEGENFEVHEMYPAYLAEAVRQGEVGAERSCRYALEAEKIHAALFTEAKQAVAGGEDMPLAAVHVCGVCGHTVVGEVPHKCPICSVGPDKFTTFA